MSFPLPHTWHADNICTTVCATPIPFGNFELKGQCLGLRTCQFQNKQTNKQKLFLLHSHLLSADLNWTSGVPAKPLYLLWDRSMWRLRRSSHQKMENSAPSPALVMLSLAMWPWMGHFISLGSVSSSVKEENESDSKNWLKWPFQLWLLLDRSSLDHPCLTSTKLCLPWVPSVLSFSDSYTLSSELSSQVGLAKEWILCYESSEK